MIFLFVPLLVQVQQPPAPRRTVPDPGVIASTQQVTPAGVQSVFDGRVTGVRFGSKPGELWVAVPGLLAVALILLLYSGISARHGE